MLDADSMPEDYKIPREYNPAPKEVKKDDSFTIDIYLSTGEYRRNELRYEQYKSTNRIFVYTQRTRNIDPIFIQFAMTMSNVQSLTSSKQRYVFIAISKKDINFVANLKNSISFEDFLKKPNGYIKNAITANILDITSVNSIQLFTFLPRPLRDKLLARNRWVGLNKGKVYDMVKDFYMAKKWYNYHSLARFEITTEELKLISRLQDFDVISDSYLQAAFYNTVSKKLLLQVQYINKAKQLVKKYLNKEL
jgi:hypothetical protein